MKPKAGAMLGVAVEKPDDGVGVPGAVLVSELAPSGAAAKSGVLFVGDLIIAVNGESVDGDPVRAGNLLRGSGTMPSD